MVDVASAPSLLKANILVVEDEFFVAEGLVRALRTAGSKIFGPYSTLPAAMSEVRSAPYHVALLDLNLHGELTYPLIDALTEIDVPVVLLSGYDCETISPPYRNLPRLQKPVTMTRLFDLLSTVLDQRWR